MVIRCARLSQIKLSFELRFRARYNIYPNFTFTLFYSGYFLTKVRAKLRELNLEVGQANTTTRPLATLAGLCFVFIRACVVCC